MLEEAQDDANPLLERLKFACIVASNLDEFFMVRVAALKNALAEGDIGPDAAGLTPAQQLQRIAERAHAMVDDLYEVLHEGILPALAERGLRLVAPAELEPPVRAALGRYLRDEVMPALTPLAIDASRPFPMLAGLSLNLAVLLAPAEGQEEERLARRPGPGPSPAPRAAAGVRGARSTCSSRTSSARSSGSSSRARRSATWRPSASPATPSWTSTTRAGWTSSTSSRRSSRTAGAAGSSASRSRTRCLRALLVARCRPGSRWDPRTSTRSGARSTSGPLMQLVDLPSLEDLRDPPLKPQPAVTAAGDALFELLDERDVVLHHPYDSFDPVVSLVSSAADDPDVLAIKQTLYRTSGDSPVVRALARAAENGKQVTVLVELLARFDEQSNIRWARALEESGCHVIYGIRGYKTHSKICLVVRRGRAGIRRYVHLGHRQLQRQDRAALHRLRPHDVRPGDRRGRLLVLQRAHRATPTPRGCGSWSWRRPGCGSGCCG